MGTKKGLDYYLNLRWSYTIEEDEFKGKKIFIVRVNELPGVCSDGDTIEEAVAGVKESITATIKLYLKQGDPIPEPIRKEKYRGNISYRTTRERHFNLARIAKQKHISMNKALDLIFDAGLKNVSLHVL